MDSAWTEIAADVYIRRYAALDQTLGLVVGGERCLVVDTGRDEVHSAELAAAVRTVTSLPWTVMITHAHWDHFFGTASFLPSPIWAHERCCDVVANHAEEMRERGLRYYAGSNDLISSAALRTARAIEPTDVLADQVTIDLDGRQVTLRHLGRGHTDNDVVVDVSDEPAVFAGDLVEQGAPPVIGSDAFPAEWPATLDRLLALEPQVVVPGHGRPVDAAFVQTQRAELETVAAPSSGPSQPVSCPKPRPSAARHTPRMRPCPLSSTPRSGRVSRRCRKADHRHRPGQARCSPCHSVVRRPPR